MVQLLRKVARNKLHEKCDLLPKDILISGKENHTNEKKRDAYVIFTKYKTKTKTTSDSPWNRIRLIYRPDAFDNALLIILMTKLKCAIFNSF